MTKRRMRPFGGALALSTLAVALTACAADADEVARSCATLVREAAFATETEDQLRTLDTAIGRCSTFGALRDAAADYPGVVGYDITTFAMLRCQRGGDVLRETRICGELLGPPTTPPALVSLGGFVATTLDGRTIEIIPDADTRFVGVVPEAVQETVDLAVAGGCPGVIARRDLWVGRVGDGDDDPATSDEASAYAFHAQQVAKYIGCDVAEFDVRITTVGTAPSTTSPASTATP